MQELRRAPEWPFLICGHNERSEPVDVTDYSRSGGTVLRLDRL